MGIGKFFGDIAGRVISNLIVFIIMAAIVLIAVRWIFGVNILSLFFGES